MDQRVGESLVARVVSGAALRLQPHTRGRQKEMLGWVAQNGHEVERFVKFGLVGISGTCIDMGVLNLLILVFGWPKFWANTCSFTLAALSNFTWNRLWSFPESRQRPVISQLGQFFGECGRLCAEPGHLSLARCLGLRPLGHVGL